MSIAESAAKPKRKAKIPAMAYFVCRTMIDPVTGAEVGCFVPSSKTDRAILRAKKIRVGDRIRMAPKKPRNEKFNRLVHGLGALVVAQIDGFEHEDAHSAVKRLQSDAGVMCESVVYQIPGGYTLTRSEPRSIAFDEMDEAEFNLFWRGICQHLITKYWPTLDESAIQSMIDLLPLEHPT